MKLKATERRHCGFPGSPLLSHWLLQWLLSVSIGNILNLHTSFFFFSPLLFFLYFFSLHSFGFSEFLRIFMEAFSCFFATAEKISLWAACVSAECLWISKTVGFFLQRTRLLKVGERNRRCWFLLAFMHVKLFILRSTVKNHYALNCL